MLPLGETLLLWRTQRRLTQEALAAKAGIPRTALSAIERGRREVTLRTLRALAAALHIRPGILADGIGPVYLKAGASFSRESLERIADRIVFGKPLRQPEERKLAKLMMPLIRSRALAAGRRVKPVGGKRALQAVWLTLRSSCSPQVIQSLLKRISDRETTV